MSLYLLDSNIFIEAKNRYYPFDVFPGFWDWLKRDMEAGVIASTKPVYDEIVKGNDELVEWVNGCETSGCFLPIDDKDTQNQYRDLANWVIKPENGYSDSACDQFLGVADSWIVAKAMSLGAVVVTHEKFQPTSKRKVQIPNVCAAFRVQYINTVELIRNVGVTFTLR